MKPIIAIFGGRVNDGLLKKKVLEAAARLGREVGRRGCILLTGASGPSTGAVKSDALLGADCAAGAGYVAPWIGVPKLGDKLLEVTDRGRAVALSPVYDDRRNYLEAFICDGAIALPGEGGTMSEVAFCLALGKPVVLVGEFWADLWPVKPGREARDAFVKEAGYRVPPSHHGAPEASLQRLIDDAYEVLEKGAGPVYRAQSLPDSDQAAAVIAQEAERLVGSVERRARIPELSELREMKRTFDPWYAALQDRLGRSL